MTVDPGTPRSRLRTGSGAGVLPSCLALCLLLAVVATALGLPAVVRTPLAVLGVLLAPGYAWLAVARSRTGQPAVTLTGLVLAVVLSLALTVLVGVAVSAVGAPVSPVNTGVGLLLVTLPPVFWVLLAGPAVEGAAVAVPQLAVWRQAARSLAPAVVAVGVFVAVVAWAASWQERPDSGPYTQLSYTGALADLTGPVDVQPGQPLALPVQVERSDGQPWSGLVTVSAGGRAQDTRTMHLDADDVVTLQATAPTEAGLYPVTVNAVSDETGEELSLTLRLRVGQP